MVDDAKLESGLDKMFPKEEKEIPAESSIAEETEGVTEKTSDLETDSKKTEEIATVKEDKTLSEDEKIAKIMEIIGDDKKTLDAYIKKEGFHKHPAWIKQRELIERLEKENKSKPVLTEEVKKRLGDFERVTSSADYIRVSMKAQGYKDEAIDKELEKRGLEVAPKETDDLALIANGLGIKPDEWDDDIKAKVSDIAKISRIIVEDFIGKILPSTIKPLQEEIGRVTQERSANKMVSEMKSIVEGEKILDFGKDIEPELNKFIDEHPNAIQEDVLSYFKDLNHRLALERKGKRQEKAENDEKKLNSRPNSEGGPRGADKLLRGIDNLDKNMDILGIR